MGDYDVEEPLAVRPKCDNAETLPQDPEKPEVVNGVVASVQKAVNDAEKSPLTTLDYSKRLSEARNGRRSVRIKVFEESYKKGLRLDIDPQDYALIVDDLVWAFEAQMMMIESKYEELIDAYAYNMSTGLKVELSKKLKEVLSVRERPQLIKIIPILELLDKFQINFQDFSLSGFRRYSSNELKFCFYDKSRAERWANGRYANETMNLKQQLVRHGLLVV